MYTRKPVTKLSGNETFNDPQKLSILDFWSYGFSNLNSNVLRGALAEFIVEGALKEKKEIDVRNPWGDHDVEYRGKSIEVKSCSYLQDWDQKELSKIQWSGLKARSLYWSSAVSAFKKDEEKDYKSDIYILALLDHMDTETLDILNLDQWSFYVISKEQLRDIGKNRNAISLVVLKKNGIPAIKFDALKQHIDQYVV